MVKPRNAGGWILQGRHPELAAGCQSMLVFDEARDARREIVVAAGLAKRLHSPSQVNFSPWEAPSTFKASTMPPRIRPPLSNLAIPFRPRPSVVRWKNSTPLPAVQPLSRCYSSSKDLPESPDGKGPNTEQLPHVSEEAAATAKATGGKGPDLEQGTPVQEVCCLNLSSFSTVPDATPIQVVKGDKAAQEKLPKVMKDDLKASKPSNSRSYSTSAIRQQDLSSVPPSELVDIAIVESGTSLMQNPTTQQPADAGHKFGLPTLPIPPRANLHHRYEPIVEQLTGLLIRHGKKGVAQRVRSCSPMSS